MKWVRKFYFSFARIPSASNEIAVSSFFKDHAISKLRESRFSAICVTSVTPCWPIPSRLSKLLSQQSNHSLKFSISVTFYHALSKQFYGTTFVGNDHTSTTSAEEDDPVISLNELIYFKSKYNDHHCYAITELIATEYSPSHVDWKGNQYGCGWSVIPLNHTNTSKNQEAYILSGTPRKLLLLKTSDLLFQCRVRWESP